MSEPGAYDVIVIGGGAAGMMASLAAVEAGATVCLVTDRVMGQSNAAMAQGGLQCPADSEESRQAYKADIERSARVPLDQTILDPFVAEARDAVLYLVDKGLEPDADEQGNWLLKKAGGMSEARAISYGDRIGSAVVKTLRQAVQQDKRIEVLGNCQVTDIEPDGSAFKVQGTGRKGESHELFAKAVVVATGGSAFFQSERLHAPTTNPVNENHVLFQRLCQQGLKQAHEGVFQFHPLGIITGPVDQCKKAFPESVMALPATIWDNQGVAIKTQEEQLDRLALSQRMFDAEKAGRAVMHEDGVPGFWLDLSAVGIETLRDVYPGTLDFLVRSGLDPLRVLIRPFLHYQTGGLWFDADCQSSVPGIFVAGEVSGGVHGHNRLFGNGLTDAVVHGRRAGRNAAQLATTARGTRENSNA